MGAVYVPPYRLLVPPFPLGIPIDPQFNQSIFTSWTEGPLPLRFFHFTLILPGPSQVRLAQAITSSALFRNLQDYGVCALIHVSGLLPSLSPAAYTFLIPPEYHPLLS